MEGETDIVNEHDVLKKVLLLNDIGNAINNTAKRIVCGIDGSHYVLHQEGGTNTEELNYTGDMLFDFLNKQTDLHIPGILTDKFREDMMMDVFETINPMNSSIKTRSPIETLARSIVPGLCSLKEQIGIMLIKHRIESLTSDQLESFFNKTCQERLCLRKLYEGHNTEMNSNQPHHIPPLCVEHEPWLYYPEEYEEQEYIKQVCGYILNFEKEQLSFLCALCSLYIKISNENVTNDDISATLTLAGTPDQYQLNKKICDLYSKHSFGFDKKGTSLQFDNLCFVKSDIPERVVVSVNEKLYY